MNRSKASLRAAVASRKPATGKSRSGEPAAPRPKPTGKRVASPTRAAKRDAPRARPRAAGEEVAVRAKKKTVTRTARPAAARRGAAAAKSAANATRTRRKTTLSAPAARGAGTARATETLTQSAAGPRAPATPPPSPIASKHPKPAQDPGARRPAPRRAIAEGRAEPRLPPEPPARKPRFRLGTFDDLIAPFPSQVQTLCLALRGLISRVVPGARETIITGLQIALFEKDGPIGLLAPQRDHARLYFVRGNELKDQSRLLQGGSGALPFVKLWHLDTLQVPALRSLLQEALELNRENPVPNLTARLFGDLAL